MTTKFNSVINLEYSKKLILILLITFALYIILIQYNDAESESFSDSISLFGDNVDFEYSAGIIYKRIRKLTNKKIKNSYVREVIESETVENEFTMNEYNIPVGVIRFFPYKLPDRYTSWVLCDGTSRIGIDYPELFRLLNNRDPLDDNEQFSVPNLVGRMIFGRRFSRANQRSPDISPIGGSGGKFMNPSNSNYFTELDTSNMSEGIPLTQIQDLSIDSALFKLSQGSSAGIKYDNLGTDGIDGCPEDDRQNTIEKKSPGNVNVCVNNPDPPNNPVPPYNPPSNMPPYIALFPYIKAKTVRYKYNI
jgi:hypothetical protein